MISQSGYILVTVKIETILLPQKPSLFTVYTHPSPTNPDPWQALTCSPFLQFCNFKNIVQGQEGDGEECYIKEIILFVTLGLMFFCSCRFIQVVCIISLLLFVAELYPMVGRHATEGQLDCLQCLIMMNKAVRNIDVQVYGNMHLYML